MKRALITGIAGQDGSYLAEWLHEKGYEVHGVFRPLAQESHFARLQNIREHLRLHSLDLKEKKAVVALLDIIQPDEIYNLAGQSFIPQSWLDPINTIELNAVVVLNLLEGIRSTNPRTKFYQANSSEMFGKALETPQRETTPFNPQTPYGAAKLYSHFMTIIYREKYGLFAASGILFNHESPRRGIEFVTRKITDAVAKIKAGKLKKLALGNLEAERDWGYAKDYVEAMWLMLQQDSPQDYVIATGKSHTVREWVEVAFSKAGLDYRNHVIIDKDLWRPVDVYNLRGNAEKAKAQLGWAPRTSFHDLISMMVEFDLKNQELKTSPV